MESIVAGMETIVRYVAELGIVLVELSGIGVLLLSAMQGVVNYARHDPRVRLKLAQGIALALEFKLGGEVLRTVIVRGWTELKILGAVIALRGALTLLLHWEIRNEENRRQAR